MSTPDSQPKNPPADQTPSGEAIPLPERGSEAAYKARPEVAALTPVTPETLTPGAAVPPTSTPALDKSITVLPAPPGSPDGIGGVLLSPEAMLNDPSMRGAVDELNGKAVPRPPSRTLFETERAQPPDDLIVKELVTSQRVRDLWNQIDALQEEVIQNVRADRTNTDIYQQDLLYASSLLLKSATNYDEAREIVYRIRGDLNRERIVTADIRRYLPVLTLYYGLWFIAVIFLARLDDQYRALVPNSVAILRLAFPPILFAVFGALFNGILAVNRHTVLQRDFDPAYMIWYLINPFIGALLGMVVFVFFVVTGTSITPNLLTDPSAASTPTPVIWLLAFIVGWQQTTAVTLLNSFLKTVSPDAKNEASAERPSPMSTGKRDVNPPSNEGRT